MPRSSFRNVRSPRRKQRRHFVGDSHLSNLYTAEVMTDSVQLRHGFVRVKLGAAHRGLGLSVNSFGSVLDVWFEQVLLEGLC